MKNCCTNICSILLLCCLPILTLAQFTETKSFQQDLGDLTDGSLTVHHRRGLLQILPSDAPQASLSLSVNVEGKYEDDVKRLINEIELSITGSGKNKTVEVADQIRSWTTVFSKSKIKFKNGEVFEGIKELDLDLVIKIPALRYLEVHNRYNDIELSGIAQEVVAELYSADLRTRDLESESLALELKYGDAEIDASKDFKAEIYEGDIVLKEAERVVISSKYSELELGDLESLELVGYEDELKVGNVAKTANLAVKYGEIELGKVGGELAIQFYETDLRCERASNVQGSAKYGDLAVQSVGEFMLSQDYEVDLELGEADQLVLQDSKYGEHEIELLKKSAIITAYETSIDCSAVGSELTKIWVDAKYDTMEFPLPDGLGVEIDAELKYGEIEYPELDYKRNSYTDKNDLIVFKASTSDSPQASIRIRTYETDVVLR